MKNEDIEQEIENKILEDSRFLRSKFLEKIELYLNNQKKVNHAVFIRTLYNSFMSTIICLILSLNEKGVFQGENVDNVIKDHLILLKVIIDEFCKDISKDISKCTLN